MAVQGTIEAIQTTVLHVCAGSLTVTSLVSIMGWVSPVVGTVAGIAAIAAYTMEILDSETFKGLMNKLRRR